MDKSISVEELSCGSKYTKHDTSISPPNKYLYSIGWNKRYYLSDGDGVLIYEYQLTSDNFVEMEVNKNKDCIKFFEKENEGSS